jgi:hypothetical protein
MTFNSSSYLADLTGTPSGSVAIRTVDDVGALHLIRLVAPPPPRGLPVDVQQEFGDLAALGVVERDGRSYGGVGGFPGVHIVIDPIEPSEFLDEQGPNILERRPRADLSLEPREITASDDKVGKPLVTAVHRPDFAVILLHRRTLAP